MLLLVGLAAVVFVEGWLGVLYRHLLADNLGTTFVTARPIAPSLVILEGREGNPL